MARPGIMLYFDILEPIRVLSDADKGKLLVAMLEYGQSGVLPQFDGGLALAWGFVRPKLDKDEDSYENAMLQRKYAGFCKSRTSRHLPKIDFEEWVRMSEEDRKRAVSGDIGPMFPISGGIGSNPTTITNTNTSTPTYTARDTSTWDKPPYGQYQNVILSDQDLAELQKEFPDTWVQRVERLSEYMASSGRSYQNHLATIRAWAKSEGAANKSTARTLDEDELAALQQMMRDG